MNATYRLQLTPDFGFAEVEALLPYFGRLGISHLYLSPITEARRGSTHGYDVIDHNCIRAAFGGGEGFEALREAALTHGLSLLLDWVPNHAGVGPRNTYWQDVLAYGPSSPYATFFDIDWNPLKPELKNKILLPFLGSQYGEVLDRGELGLSFDDGRFYATYFESRFALSPSSYPELLELALPALERTDAYFDFRDLTEDYRTLLASERDKAEGLRTRLLALSDGLDIGAALERFPTEEMHGLLETQFWRLAYWKTAGFEINYRRFFDINELVGLRMENPEVFWDSHRLLGELVVKEGIEGVRIDHIDGLFDPEGYLDNLKTLGAKRVWVEKILAPGETLPVAWATNGTTGYEFMNDVMGVLIRPGGEHSLKRLYRREVEEILPYEDEVHRSKRLVIETSLAGELTRLAGELNALSEGDYRTRDFTLESLREALAEVVAAFERYRTYLPHSPEEAKEVVREAILHAKRRNPAFELSVYDFIEKTLLGEVPDSLSALQREFVGRFQQYTAPVAAKGVEDTTFYRYVPLVALNEVGGEPDSFGTTPQAFHARARFRAYRYPQNLLATATHDHKRGEDTRMRLVALAELHEAWGEVVSRLESEAQHHRTGGLETAPQGQGPSNNDAYLFYQLLVALWEGEERERLAERLVAYMQKAAREAKLHSSWLNPNEAYEAALERFVREMTASDAVKDTVEGLAGRLAHYGFRNTLSQLVLKLTTPGVPDLYQGTELLDLSLVDPDNRHPVDYEHRQELVEGFEGMLATPDGERIREMYNAGDETLKLYLTTLLLCFRKAHPDLFAGDYRALEPEGEGCEYALTYTRESEEGTLLVVVPRFPVALEGAGWTDTAVPLPETLQGRRWRDLLSGEEVRIEAGLELSRLSLPLGLLFNATS